ncbi:unnamed protein product [Rotaria sp. Silwood1]|nr:unnamed protein product [Rotaria sp. Silwood1]CAF1593223.1 unnamed protein product [Rotaria sp. Silwood1]CAF3709260.1 unnamed protein product [Rotaria sp. Silwood1]CAF4838695.1 unnamed protein product [Rotaria sp. Silwood1]
MDSPIMEEVIQQKIGGEFPSLICDEIVISPIRPRVRRAQTIKQNTNENENKNVEASNISSIGQHMSSINEINSNEINSNETAENMDSLNIDENTLPAKNYTDDNQSNIQSNITTYDLFDNGQIQSSMDDNYFNNTLPFVHQLSIHHVLTNNQFDDNISPNDDDYVQNNCISPPKEQFQHNHVIVKDILSFGNDIQLNSNECDDISTLSINDMDDDVLPAYILQLQQDRQDMIKDFDSKIDATKLQLDATKLQLEDIANQFKNVSDKLYNLIDTKHQQSEKLLKKINQHLRKYKSKNRLGINKVPKTRVKRIKNRLF